MPINFPKFDTLDYGAAVQSGQQITENRIRNQMLGVAQQEQQNVMRNRDKAAAIRKKMLETPDTIKELQSAGLFDEADKLRVSYQKQLENGISLIKATRGGINKDNYKVWRERQIKGGHIPYDLMPEEYSDAWFGETLQAWQSRIEHVTEKYTDPATGETRERSRIFLAGKEVSLSEYDVEEDTKGQNIVLSHTYFDKNLNKTMVQDRVIIGGKEEDAGEPYPAGSGRGGKPWEMNNAQLNGIKKSMAEVFDGNYDSVTGAFQLPDDRQEEKKQIAAIVRDAAERYQAKKGSMNMHEAAMLAIEAAGLPIPKAKLNDPDNILPDEDEVAGGGPSSPLG